MINSDTKLKIAQLVFPRLNIDEYLKNAEYRLQIDELIELGVGGFCVFKGSYDQAKVLLPSLISKSKIPLLFCGDFENGLDMRLENAPEFPHAMSLGKNKPENISQISGIIADLCKSIGVFWNLAPVADINSNQDNPIINIRSFGDTPEVVTKAARAYFEGMKKAGVMSCYKHFPGHGDTSVDSHISIPSLSFDKNRILNFELKPFIDAINNNVDSIMMAHIAVPALDPDSTPASLSYKIITDFLIKELGFKGIIVSDALDMKGITSLFSNNEVALKAFRAGNDVLLMPDNPKDAVNYIFDKIKESDIEKLEFSYNKIINKKEELGLFDFKPYKFNLSEEKIQTIALKAGNIGIELIGKKSFTAFG